MSKRTLAAVSAILITLSMFSATAAAAAEPDDPAACTVGGVAVPAGEPMPEEIPTVISCFDTVAEAEQFIEDGAPGDIEQLLETGPAARGAAVAASTVTIGKVWTGTSRSGSVLIHWGTGSGCYGVTYGFPTLASGWNKNIQSAEGYSSCWASHYDTTSYGGDVLTCAPYCATLGFMASRSSSIVCRPVGTFG